MHLIGPIFYMALASAALGESGDADYYLHRAESLAVTTEKKTLVQQLRQDIKRQ